MAPRWNTPRTTLAALLLCALAPAARAIPDFVDHTPATPVYQATEVTERPAVIREDEPAVLYFRVGYSNYYTDVALYYTTDGSAPVGSFGTAGSAATKVLRNTTGGIAFYVNEPHAGTNAIDWWKATLPPYASKYAHTLKYVIGAWYNNGGQEVFANTQNCSGGCATTPTVFSYDVNKIAWPGKGSPYAAPDRDGGYPVTYFYKEEGVVGNGDINVQLDRNGAIYDVYYPSAGCVQGMGTKNEGYSDGDDTFPAGTPPGNRGQMNLNTAFGGIRYKGETFWQTNEDGGDYTDVSQSYLANTNVLQTTSTLGGNGAGLSIVQFDFSPKGSGLPNDGGGNAEDGMSVKRYVLINTSGADRTVNMYFYMDPALNGGDSYDAMFADAARGAMAAYDNTDRLTSISGEYNPTTTGDYHKGVSVYLAAAMKLCDKTGGASGTPATDFWSDTSADQGQGWIGMKVAIPAGATKEVDVLLAGGFDNFPNATGTYDYQVAPAIDWFQTTSMDDVMTATTNYWSSWLNGGTTVTTPDARYNDLFRRGLLATDLHQDRKNGGIVAGMHNGAYPFVWPRDAVYAAITLDRTGHTAEAGEVYRFLKDVAYRPNEPDGHKAFYSQKYTTDGYTVWASPQVDETANVPWGAYYHYKTTGDLNFLTGIYSTIKDAARDSSEDSAVDARLYYDDPYHLMHGNNVWEDSFDDFLYSNAAVERGLRDFSYAAGAVGNAPDATEFARRADDIHTGLVARAQFDGENTDISQLGLEYPFHVFSPTDPLVTHLADRINGTSSDTYGNNHPLIHNDGEFVDLIDRYWGDNYWKGGPWFLSTAWYGLYYADKADYTGGKTDIDNHKKRLDALLDRLGPLGFGAEQIAPLSSATYPDNWGGKDVLETAWPNAWESESTFVDAVMAFVGFAPDAPANNLVVSPKLPTAWSSLSVNNLKFKNHVVHLSVNEDAANSRVMHTFTNVSGTIINFGDTLRIPAGTFPARVLRDGASVAASDTTFDSNTGQVHVHGVLNTDAGKTTALEVDYAVAFTQADAMTALRVAGGLGAVTASDAARLNVEGGQGTPFLDIADAVRIARKVFGTDANP